ncbi:Phosphatidylinositol transfer protein 3-like protein [Drosera capensis]
MESSSGQQSEEDTYDSQEQQKLCLMRTFVGSHDPSAKVIDDLTLTRFLRARDLDVEKGGAMFLKYLKWRKEFVPTGSISEAEIQDELVHNKVFLQGSDKRGCPVIVIIARNHCQSKKPGGLDELKRLVVYCFDKICSRLPVGEEKFIAIIDLQGWGYANSDIRGYLALLSLMQDCYPERLRKIFLIHAPRIFMTVWKIIYPFIDNRTREKFIFVENKMLKTTLLQEIEESQIPDIYGGMLPLIPIHQS